MSYNPEDEIREELRDRGEGYCPHCGYPLSIWGAASRGDGYIYNEIGCDRCEEVIDERHASYCKCPDCDPYGLDNDEEDSWKPCSECDGHDACRDFGCAFKHGLGHLVKKDNPFEW